MEDEPVLQVLAAGDQLLEDVLVVQLAALVDVLLQGAPLAVVRDQVAVVLREVEVVEFYNIRVL